MLNAVAAPTPTRGEMNSFVFSCAEIHAEEITKFLDTFGLSVINGIADHGVTALGVAATTGNFEAVKTLLEKGAAVDARDKYEYTALIWAGGESNLAVVQLLIENDADVNARSKSGYTPLIWAALRGRTEVAAFLLRHGADINMQDGEGRPLKSVRKGWAMLILCN